MKTSPLTAPRAEMQISTLINRPPKSGNLLATVSVATADGGRRALEAQRVEKRPVDQQIEHRHGDRTQHQRADDVSLRILHLGGDVGHLVPAAEGEQHQDQAPRSSRTGETRAGRRGGRRGEQGDDHDRQQPQRLDRGQHVLGPLALSDAQHVDDGEDRHGRQGVSRHQTVSGVYEEGRRRPVDADRSLPRVGGEGEGHDGDIARPHHASCSQPNRNPAQRP